MTWRLRPSLTVGNLKGKSILGDNVPVNVENELTFGEVTNPGKSRQSSMYLRYFHLPFPHPYSAHYLSQNLIRAWQSFRSPTTVSVSNHL
jgi:hypothetical protein